MECLVGYQGEEGSNSQEAARLFADKCGIIGTFVPLVSSERVASAVEDGTITYGVMAIRNTLGGQVLETEQALDKYRSLKQVDCIELPIHHSLFCKSMDAETKICKVVSHIQALLQTRNYRAEHYPEWEELEYADTALAAKDLAKGLLPDTTAVICRKNAGEMNNLYMIAENIEDNKQNYTTFGLFQKSTN